MEAAKLLDITITDDQISTSHRLQPRIKRDNTMPTISPPIIVRFVGRDVRNNVYFNRKLKKHDLFSTQNLLQENDRIVT